MLLLNTLMRNLCHQQKLCSRLSMYMCRFTDVVAKGGPGYVCVYIYIYNTDH